MLWDILIAHLEKVHQFIVKKGNIGHPNLWKGPLMSKLHNNESLYLERCLIYFATKWTQKNYSYLKKGCNEVGSPQRRYKMAPSCENKLVKFAYKHLLLILGISTLGLGCIHWNAFSPLRRMRFLLTPSFNLY